MLQHLNWLVSGRVLYWKLPNGSTTEDFCDGLLEFKQVLEKTSNKLHIIIDARTAQSLVGNTSYVSRVASDVAKHTMMGSCFVISHSFLFKHQLNRVTYDFGTNLRYSDTFSNTWKSLYDVDTNLPYVAPNPPTLKAKVRRRGA